VFPTVFYPNLSPAMATVGSMGTFATAFRSRPLGAVVFGHFGDRLGRKRTLVATLLIMALSTVTVGLVPGSATVGAAAPLILITLRLLQGFAVGGEWAGSALLSAETAPAGQRGRYGMFTVIGGGIALLLTSLTFLGVNFTIGEGSSAFMTWGWRIPFLFSGILIAIALYVRLNIKETPVFAQRVTETVTATTPFAEVLRLQRREIGLAAGCVLGCFGLVYLASTYLTAYAHTHLGYSRNVILLIGALGGLTCIASAMLTSVLCDRFGRRRVILVCWSVGVPWALLVMPLIDSGSVTMFAVAIAGLFAVDGAVFGPVTSFVPELFPTRYRYTGTALSINLAGVLGGAVPPLIAGPLLSDYGSWAIGRMMATPALLSLVATYLLPETTGAVLAEPAQLACSSALSSRP